MKGILQRFKYTRWTLKIAPYYKANVNPSDLLTFYTPFDALYIIMLHYLNHKYVQEKNRRQTSKIKMPLIERKI